ncbi:hypothetical protein PVAND_002631 [Polypedilum vanderplanki]|uniref:AN1-type domain-containing protein n=1 Tax=Polypedilum vanderplanki TaxID=319348 RepID=A0A9J6BSQ8_POLVA|nr:hypothetical protein PVAND_002631 [Polypedilum vanderplanki]
MEFPHLGQHCKMEFCNKLDFLPISCDACKQTFCSEHYSYIQHNCTEGQIKRDNQVPVCPICMKPVPSEKGREDYAVSQHIDKFCKSETKIYTNNCSFGNCKKKELVPFTCSSCKSNFCLKHRHADVHNCKGPIKQRDILANAAARRCSDQASQSRNLQDNSNFQKVQGTLSEDEALAKAIYESMLENEQRRNITVGGTTAASTSSNDRNKNCAIS